MSHCYYAVSKQMMNIKSFCLQHKSSCLLTAKLISAFVFATRIVQFLFFLNPKFQASSHLLCLYSTVCIRPGWIPRRPVFSRHGSIEIQTLNYYVYNKMDFPAQDSFYAAVVCRIIKKTPLLYIGHHLAS